MTSFRQIGLPVVLVKKFEILMAVDDCKYCTINNTSIYREREKKAFQSYHVDIISDLIRIKVDVFLFLLLCIM
jgi:hypothetical protein